MLLNFTLILEYGINFKLKFERKLETEKDNCKTSCKALAPISLFSCATLQILSLSFITVPKSFYYLQLKHLSVSLSLSSHTCFTSRTPAFPLFHLFPTFLLSYSKTSCRVLPPLFVLFSWLSIHGDGFTEFARFAKLVHPQPALWVMKTGS